MYSLVVAFDLALSDHICYTCV